MDKENLVEETFENRKKISQETKDGIITSIFFNIILAIVMMIITLLINVSFNKLQLSDFSEYIKYVQSAMAIISIVFFEVAYKKDSMRIGMYAIEITVFSIAVLYVPYMYIFKENIHLLKITVILFSVYYLIKSIVTAIIKRHNYLKDNMSDVKEIVKDEKKGYIDEDSEKTLKARKEEKIKTETNKSKNTNQTKKSKNKNNKK